MRITKLAFVIFASVALANVASLWAQDGQLKTADAVLERYKVVLGGVDAIKSVQSETVHGEIEGTGLQGKSTFVAYSKPFKSIFKVTRPDGTQVTSGFDGAVSWSIDAKGASIDKDTPVEANRRDADLQYPLHQPDYFKKLELAGVVDFEGHRCYWLHGTTHWGKDNNQFYDVETGLLAGYRYEADDSSKTITILTFEDYKKIGGRLVATRQTLHTGDHIRTFTMKSVSYEPIEDSVFDLPAAVKVLVN
jgi:outer membrane lipoprotein-sorting protein